MLLENPSIVATRRNPSVAPAPRRRSNPTPEVVGHPATAAGVAAAASLFQTTDPGRAGKRLPAVLRALALRDVAGAEQRLLTLESGAGVHRFRRRLATAFLPDDVVLETAALLARSAADNLDRQGRVELLLRRLLVVSSESGEQILSRAAAADALDAVADGTRAPADVRERALAFFHDAVAKLHACESVDDVFSQWVIADVLGYKATLGEAFRDPDVLYASIAFAVEVEKRLELCSAHEGLAAGDVTYRLWKLELELRTMFRQSGDETFEAGAFEKVDWRRFKWRRGLARLRDAKKVTTKRRINGRVLRGFLAASVLLFVASHFRPEAPEELTASPIAPADISTLVGSAVTNGSATVLQADPERWDTMDDAQRAEEAALIRSHLFDKGVGDALVEAHGAIAIRIERGAVMFVAKAKKRETK